jgi:hypothetical protein
MDYLETQATLDTGHRTKTNKKFKHKKENKKMINTDRTKKTWGWTQVLAKSKQYDLIV